MKKGSYSLFSQKFHREVCFPTDLKPTLENIRGSRKVGATRAEGGQPVNTERGLDQKEKSEHF